MVVAFVSRGSGGWREETVRRPPADQRSPGVSEAPIKDFRPALPPVPASFVHPGSQDPAWFITPPRSSDTAPLSRALPWVARHEDSTRANHRLLSSSESMLKSATLIAASRQTLFCGATQRVCPRTLSFDSANSVSAITIRTRQSMST
ncbi:hypothetical protein HPB50_021959 [Hyalomma asiaticum]|uniref:Uncharacterized protein n=1 Tax=Hyalomma asiaticum TaxID=266040 RepID=A0ACB7TSK3_HYAAI|nr:hypothetical protein HPB50_021959 [Hyalomma asiaticum]